VSEHDTATVVTYARHAMCSTPPHGGHVRHQYICVRWSGCTGQRQVARWCLFQHRASGPLSRTHLRCATFVMQSHSTTVVRLWEMANTTCLVDDPTAPSWTTLSKPSDRSGYAQQSYSRGVSWRGRGLAWIRSTILPNTSVIQQYDPLTDAWSEWTPSLPVTLATHIMLNVDLRGVWQSEH